MNSMEMYLNEMAKRSHTTSVEHGFWEDKDTPSGTIVALGTLALEVSFLGKRIEFLRTEGPGAYAGRIPPQLIPLSPQQITALAKLVLIVSEVAEAVDAIIENTGNLEEELADIHIRTFDLGKAVSDGLIGIPAKTSGQAILEKSLHNESRPRKHGKLA